MKLEDQVLSLEQVRELQELGFDFRKYSSACVIEAKDRNKYIVDRKLIGLHIGFMETEVIEYHETMTIGDIIDILPHHKFLLEKGYEDTNMYHLEHKFSSLEGIKILQHESGSFLRLLFDNLKWCIINKLIES